MKGYGKIVELLLSKGALTLPHKMEATVTRGIGRNFIAICNSIVVMGHFSRGLVYDPSPLQPRVVAYRRETSSYSTVKLQVKNFGVQSLIWE